MLNNVLPPLVDNVKQSFVAVFADTNSPTPDILHRVKPLKASACNKFSQQGGLFDQRPTFAISSPVQGMLELFSPAFKWSMSSTKMHNHLQSPT
ncbi:hypothetical protein DACRYDRAFT_105439 [Dacryopinax primogenitus]|uniref:Uncharacterized protein n=1 Tax=Dacryopinax primogenitus (strain DJM 731) TaxID=1858805 RepID=M5GFS2_DACPD|nr:uncharacterized protein DACRYDRAFT_105439 [Dacryopinax primogenitus]EJU04378.1 hypothetical protein DACRYDRAFT_105439 [Dacryopinax primogenitus]